MKPLTPWFKKSVPAVRREEEYPFYSLQKEMNNLFQEFFSNFELSPHGYGEHAFGDFSPRVDMHETPKEFTVTAELPGMEEKDIQLKLAGDVLTISGEKRNEKIEDVKGTIGTSLKDGKLREAFLTWFAEIKEQAKVKNFGL